MNAPIQERADFAAVRYANCWEDPRLLIEGLQPEGRRILSICSAGDNCLALAASGAREVLAVDLSPAQIACFQIRRAALRELDHPGLLEFLGERESDAGARRELYRTRLRRHLEAGSADFWDAHQGAIGAGILGAGRFEGFLDNFRRRWLPLIRRRSTVARLLELDDARERREFWERTWNDRTWRVLFSLAFSRPMLARGRDPEFLRYAQGPLAPRLRARVERTCLDFPVGSNPWLRRILTGAFGDALPFWLRPGNLEAVRAGAERIRTAILPVEDAADRGGWEAMNLSDIFEYMSPDLFRRFAGRLRSGCAPEARVAHWNLFAPRRLCQVERGFRHLEEESIGLFGKDRACFYLDFRLEEAVP